MPATCLAGTRPPPSGWSARRSASSKPARPTPPRTGGDVVLARTSRPIGVLGRRKGAAAHLIGIGAGPAADLAGEITVAFDELRRELREHTEHVVGDEDLAVACRRGADADR